MATLLKVATTLGPAVFSGLSHEWDVMKQDPTPLSLKRAGHGFKAFGEGFAGSLLGTEKRGPNSRTGTNGHSL